MSEDPGLIPFDVGPDCQPSGTPFRNLIDRRQPRPRWDACPQSREPDGCHSLDWFDNAACRWCGDVAQRCPECGAILMMHHDPRCTQPCEMCAQAAGRAGVLRAEGRRYWQERLGARLAEERGRREWIDGVKRRLGLVTAEDDPGERTFATYEEAWAAARAAEAAYAAALPGRAQEIADQISAVLPDGLRFEWVTYDE